MEPETSTKKNELPVWNRQGGSPQRRFDHYHEPASIGTLDGRNPGFDAVPGETVSKNEVFVPAVLLIQTDDRALPGFEKSGHFVGRRTDFFDGNRGCQPHANVELIGLRFPGFEVGIGDPTVFQRIRPTTVAWSHHRGKHEFILGVFRHQNLRILQLHLDAVPGHDVRHIHGKDVAAFLFQQRSPFPGLLGLLVLFASLSPFIDHRLYRSFPDPHSHAVDRGPRRGGKHIYGFDGFFPRVLEHLEDSHPGNDSQDIRLHAGFLHGKTFGIRIFAGDEEVGSNALFASLFAAGHGRGKSNRSSGQSGIGFLKYSR